MTNNYHLLFRLAELMLEYEQHFLPLDILFDDVQIGDHVKSIQIDSPYQQLLFEGVITESVTEGKLYVSFTIEGYFHYVLGEVIYEKSFDKNIEVFNDFINNKLNGALEGIGIALIKFIIENDFTRIIDLFKTLNNASNFLYKPLAHLFIYLYSLNSKQFNFNNCSNERIENLLNNLLNDVSENSIVVLNKAINMLDNNQNKKLLNFINQHIHELIVPNSSLKLKLYLNSIKYVSFESSISKLDSVVSNNEFVYLYFNDIGVLYALNYHFDKAIYFYKKALKYNIQTYGPNHISVGEVYNNLGVEYANKSYTDKAICYFEKALSINIHNYGYRHFSTSYPLNNLGIEWSNKGDYVKAYEYYTKSLSNDLENFGYYHPNTAESFNNLGVLHVHLEKYTIALEYYNKVLAIRTSIFGELHPLVAELYTNIGALWYVRGDYNSALENYYKSLHINLDLFNEQHPSLAFNYSNIANIFIEQGEFNQAKILFEKAHIIFTNSFGSNHPHTLSIIQIINNLSD